MGELICGITHTCEISSRGGLIYERSRQWKGSSIEIIFALTYLWENSSLWIHLYENSFMGRLTYGKLIYNLNCLRGLIYTRNYLWKNPFMRGFIYERTHLGKNSFIGGVVRIHIWEGVLYESTHLWENSSLWELIFVRSHLWDDSSMVELIFVRTVFIVLFLPNIANNFPNFLSGWWRQISENQRTFCKKNCSKSKIFDGESLICYCGNCFLFELNNKKLLCYWKIALLGSVFHFLVGFLSRILLNRTAHGVTYFKLVAGRKYFGKYKNLGELIFGSTYL